MSRTIDKLKKLSQAAPLRMGFRTSQPAKTVLPLIIIGRTAVKTNAATVKTDSGADAILVYADKASLSAVNVQKTANAFGGIPWGVYLEESEKTTAALVEAGCDFVVFSPATRVTDLPQDERVGKIVEVDSSMDNGLLRAINDLPADAVLVTDKPGKSNGLVWRQIMIYRHLINLINKPMIVPVAANISEAELKALQDTEVNGVMAEIDGENLKELRKTISKLPPRSVKKRETTGVILPRTGSEGTSIKPPDEEEEE
jgi:hypothetical protein